MVCQYSENKKVINEAMELAKKGKSKDLFDLLEKEEYNVNYMNKNGETLVSAVLKELNNEDSKVNSKLLLNVLTVLSNFDCDFNVPVDEDENTAFMSLMLIPNSESCIYNILTKKEGNFKVDASKKNKYGENVSSLIIKLKDTKLHDYMVAHSNTFDYQYRDPVTGNTLLHLCAIYLPNFITKCLMLERCNINDVNFQNENVLIIATRSGCIESIKSLLANNIDINHQDNLGNTALHYAVMLNQPYIVALLCSKNADKTIKNNEGKTAIDLVQVIDDKNAIIAMNKDPKSFIKNHKKVIKAFDNSESFLKKHKNTKTTYLFNESQSTFNYLKPNISPRYLKWNNNIEKIVTGNPRNYVIITKDKFSHYPN